MNVIQNQIDDIFRSRYHGAANIKGIRFQILNSIKTAFELYGDNAPESVYLEAIEDIDVRKIKILEIKKIKISNRYIQVKTSINPWHWSTFKNSRVIENFLEIFTADPNSQFVIVTDFYYKDKLQELADFCDGKSGHLPEAVKNDLEKIFRSVGVDQNQVEPFLKRLKFSRQEEEEVLAAARESIVRHYNLETNNAEIYLLALIAEFLDMAVGRQEIRVTDLEKIKLRVQKYIDEGNFNPAVRNNWIERLEFQRDKFSGDYYEGANARPGHILAGLDVERTQWLEMIRKGVEAKGTCIIRTASGQGKSTLLYRYAYQNYQPETTFIIRNLMDETMVGPIKKSILAMKPLQLPILVLIDNVGANLRYWYKLIGELQGHGVHFVVTMREEDWFRYSGDAGVFDWEIITPELSLEEARKIFAEFKKKNCIAPGIESAEMAFEQVAERKLLLEYTYLITHGEMLEQRLQQQVRKMQELKEDKAKLEVLRLVSVAQKYESKITVTDLAKNVAFEADPDLTLESLRREYLLFLDGVCEGLHLVRSQHLAGILHQVIPIEKTCAELISFLDRKNLAQFVAAVFSDTEIAREGLLEALLERCRMEPLETAVEVAKSLFSASERIYFYDNLPLFEQAKENIGNAGVQFLSMATMAFMPFDPLQSFNEILGGNANLEFLIEQCRRFRPRDWEKRPEIFFVQDKLKGISDQMLQENFDSLGRFLDWCRLPGIDPAQVREVLRGIDWTEKILNAEITPTAEFLFNLHHFDQELFNQIVQEHKEWLFGRYKLATETLLIEERDEDIYIEFVVDESPRAKEPHIQASDRLNLLYQLFPTYQHYCSQGLYTVDLGLGRVVDDSHKEFPLETLEMGKEASKNSIFSEIVESHYAASHVYEWQKNWYELRRGLAKFMESFIEVLQKGSLGKKANAAGLDIQLAVLRERIRTLGVLPAFLGERVQKAQRQLTSWSGDVNNFLNQVAEEKENSRRLCRYNLREAAKNLAETQKNLEIISKETTTYFDFEYSVSKEYETYMLLADMLDIVYDENRKAPAVNLKWYVEKRRKRRDEKCFSELHRALLALEEKGLKFIYPDKFFVSGNESSLILGFEVIDFAQIFPHMGAIITALADLSFEYSFLHLAPLVNGRPYHEKVWRISPYSITEIVKEGKEKPWALLPVEVDKEMLSLISNKEILRIPEMEW